MINKNIKISLANLAMGIVLFSLQVSAKGQSIHSENQPDSMWIGKRIIMLQGFGEVNAFDINGHIQIKGVPNIVAPVSRIEGNKIWILSPGEITPGGWVDKRNVILLSEAIFYFTLLI